MTTRYAVTLTKTIVVHVEAGSPSEAAELALANDSDADGAWSNAEPVIEHAVDTEPL